MDVTDSTSGGDEFNSAFPDSKDFRSFHYTIEFLKYFGVYSFVVARFN